jgi:A/G-specific adenine glycosylase
MRKREGKDIWNGLYDFYLIESTKPKSIDKLLVENKSFTKIEVAEVSKIYKHVLSHQHLIARFISVNPIPLSSEALKGFKYYSLNEIKRLPKPVLILQYLKDEGILE